MKLFDVYPLYDLALVKGRGSYVYDQLGQAWLDLYGGHAVISIGHSHPHYVQTLARQAGELVFYSNSVQLPLQEQLAQRLGTLSGYDDYHLFLISSGAEANENALKLASFRTGRKAVLAFNKSFHGRTSLAVAATDNPAIVAPVNSGHDIIYTPLNDHAALEAAFAEHGSGLCAAILEGIQGVAGIYEATTEFWQLLARLCKDHGVMLVADEVQSGYGRSGRFFAHQHHGVQPDLITVAKGMGNGYPIGGLLIAPHFQAKHGLLGTTFGGAPLACAAGIAVLEVIEEEDLVTKAAADEQWLVPALASIPGVVEVRGRGLMLGIELARDAAGVRKALLNEHRMLLGSASQKNTVRLLPALNVPRAELEKFVEALTKVLAA